MSNILDKNENKDKLKDKENDIITENEKEETNKTKIINNSIYKNKHNNINKNKNKDTLNNSSSSSSIKDKNEENDSENNIEENDLNTNNKNNLHKIKKKKLISNDSDSSDINRERKKMPHQFTIFSTEKIDLMYGPEQALHNKNEKKIENRIVKEHYLKIFDNPDNKNRQNENFSPEKQDIQKFDVLIEPELSPQKKDGKSPNIIVRKIIKSINPDPSRVTPEEKKIEKIDNENQTLNDEYTISKQNKNQFTIFSDPSNKQLLFNKERTQFDSINSFSIKIDKKKINKNDLYKSIDIIRKVLIKNIYANLINLIKEKNNNNNKKETLKNIIIKRDNINNNSILKKYFDIWKNSHSLKERTLHDVIQNLLNKKLRLKKLINDLSNNTDNNNENANKESRNDILKHYINIWKVNAMKIGDIYQKNKKRISVRKNYKKSKNNKNILKMNKMIKQKMINKDLLKKYLKKWKDNALNSDSIITYNKILKKIILYLKNKKEEEIKNEKVNKNEELVNKLKKALLQSMLRVYKEQRNKIIKKNLYKWRQKTKKINKYMKKLVAGNSIYKSQDKSLSNSLVSYSNLDSISSNEKQYYPKKKDKQKSNSKNKKNNKTSNIEHTQKDQNNNDNFSNNMDDSHKQERHTYNPNEFLPKNISFGDFKSFNHEQTDDASLPNKILEKIKRRSEQYSNEYRTEINDSTDPKKHKKVVSMIQRIQQTYHSPNQSMNSHSNTNSNVNSSKDIINSHSQSNIFKTKKKRVKTKKTKKEIMNKVLEENKEQLSDDSSVNNSILNGINLKETKIENLKPVIYTSQSFFIDKKSINITENKNMVTDTEISSISFYKNPINKYPMKMKGDFRKLLEKNPEILKQKNPRIQVTNATCELEQFEEREKNDLYKKSNNLLKLRPNLNIKINQNKSKKKDLTKVVYNCDKDIYESQVPYETQKQSWISMSIPLNNDKAKWKFLNGLKGERHKNNSNKFELIQKNKLKVQATNKNTVKLVEQKRGKSKKNQSLSKILEDSIEDNVQYNLREMNYTQFYRSPLVTKKRDGYVSTSPITVKMIRKFEKSSGKKRNGTHHSRINSVNYNTYSLNLKSNIDQLSEES